MSVSGCILLVEPTGLKNELAVECKKLSAARRHLKKKQKNR